MTEYDPLFEQVEDVLLEALGHKVTAAEVTELAETIMALVRTKLEAITDG